MIVSDLVRALALLSVPLAAALGMLTYVHLCLVSVVTALGNIAFQAASTAHLQALISEDDRPRANSRFEGTQWTSNMVGGPLGGALVSFVGTTASMAFDAVSFIFSAMAVRRLRATEPPAPRVGAPEPRRVRWVEGWRCIREHAGLRALFLNAMFFTGGLIMTSPMQTVFVLRDLHFAPWQFGLSSGVACLGGLVGSLLAPRLLQRFDERSVLLTAGVARTFWVAPILLAPPGTGGVVVVTASDFLLLLCAGVFNPTFVTYRMREAPRTHVSRVLAAWSISASVTRAVAVLLGGLMAGLAGVRVSIAFAAVICVASCAFLPWTTQHERGAELVPDRRQDT